MTEQDLESRLAAVQAELDAKTARVDDYITINEAQHDHLVALQLRCEALEDLLHRACNMFENITVADTLEIAKDRAHRGVSFTMTRKALAGSASGGGGE